MNAIQLGLMLLDPLPPGLSGLERWAVFVSALTAGLLALGQLARMARRGYLRARAWWREFARRAEALEVLVRHELTPNSGGSIYDKVTRLDGQHRENAEAIAANTAQLQELRESLSTLAEAQANMWPAIEAVALSQPPPPERTAAR